MRWEARERWKRLKTAQNIEINFRKLFPFLETYECFTPEIPRKSHIYLLAKQSANMTSPHLLRPVDKFPGSIDAFSNFEVRTTHLRSYH